MGALAPVSARAQGKFTVAAARAAPLHNVARREVAKDEIDLTSKPRADDATDVARRRTAILTFMVGDVTDRRN